MALVQIQLIPNKKIILSSSKSGTLHYSFHIQLFIGFACLFKIMKTSEANEIKEEMRNEILNY